MRNNTDYFSFIWHKKSDAKNQLQLTLLYVIILDCDACKCKETQNWLSFFLPVLLEILTSALYSCVRVGRRVKH